MSQTFVTGGSGFIGQALVRRLIAEGHTVRALVRSQGSAEKVAALGAEPVLGDLTDAGEWRNALIGSEVVFHLAAETDAGADRARHVQVSVDGTRAVIDASRQAHVPRLVHCGTEAALLAGEPLVEVDETAPLRPDSEAAYCAVKAVAEQDVLDANSGGLATVVIRPRFVWGPGSIVTEGLASVAQSGQLAWIDGGRFTTDVTYVDNVVEGFMLGWRHGRGGNAYFVTDQHRVILRDFLETLFGIYGVDAAIPDIDSASADAVIPPPNRWFLGQECTLRTEKAVAELGYRPIVSHEQGLDAVRQARAAARA